MPRAARIVVPGCPHHITQRGNNRQDVFFVDEDRRRYLAMLREQAPQFGLRIHAYCLMNNHVHLVAVPQKESSLAQAVGRTHWLYAQYINRLHGRAGHLWQNRFYSCALDEDHYLRAMAYAEQNPVRAGLARRPWRWPWSSAAAHCGEADNSGLLDMIAWRKWRTAEQWQAILLEGQDEQLLRVVRQGLSCGRPLGGDAWLAKLEVSVGRRLRPLPVGRPKKKTKEQ